MTLDIGDNVLSFEATDVAGNASAFHTTLHRIDSSGAPDPVLFWNRTALEAIRLDATTPPVATRILAMMHAAMYDVVSNLEGTSELLRGPAAAGGRVPRGRGVGGGPSRALVSVSRPGSHLGCGTDRRAGGRSGRAGEDRWTPVRHHDRRGGHRPAPAMAGTRLSMTCREVVPACGSPRGPCSTRPSCHSGPTSSRLR